MSFSAAGFHPIGYFSVEVCSVRQRLEAEEGEVMEIVFTCGGYDKVNTCSVNIVAIENRGFIKHLRVTAANELELLHRLKSSVPVSPQRSLPCSPFTTTLAV